MKFNLIGPYFGTDGYSNHMKGLFNGLSKFADVRLSVQLFLGWEKVATDKEVIAIKKDPNDRINIIVTNPCYWKLNLGKRNWAYLVWEGDKIPTSWILECLNPEIEKIIVPSKHTYDAIKKAFGEFDPVVFEDKIKIVPHGVDLNLFYPKDKPKEIVFACNKGWRNLEDRGGIQYAVQAYVEEFKKTDNVKLIIKINPAYGQSPVQQMMNELVKGKTDLPRIEFLISPLKYEDMVNFYNMANVFVAPSRAEAFGIPMLEALACGLPVITTTFGGQTDFVNNENGWLINGELTEVKNDMMYEGIKWLTPSITELRKVMREIYDKPEIVQPKGVVGLKTASKYTWEDSAKKLLEFV